MVTTKWNNSFRSYAGLFCFNLKVYAARVTLYRASRKAIFASDTGVISAYCRIGIGDRILEAMRVLPEEFESLVDVLLALFPSKTPRRTHFIFFIDVEPAIQTVSDVISIFPLHVGTCRKSREKKAEALHGKTISSDSSRSDILLYILHSCLTMARIVRSVFSLILL